ncbi:hypothetical protein CAEBREN_16304 [Caenorhabditis brenneri]|uniref:Uncharacterized protein n=1 Tax=Caenorhabditis brenneri TaxID=135651 RepID=G0PCL4_CAEBE|nr:hypothetical protein CAEBREN_16304 [Caenorhabditis brenneri]
MSLRLDRQNNIIVESYE